MGKGRLEAFSDGVIAILITIMVLEMRVPVGASLVVGLNSDASARGLGKAPGRPLNHEGDRATVLAALESVSLVTLFDEATPLELLKLVRPDLYCTVAAPSVRKQLSEVLEMPQNHFGSSEGYIKLLRLVHASPWFQSSKPRNADAAEVWRRRTAFLDAIIYE